MTVHALRLRPGDDLKRSLRAYAEANGLKAGILLTCSGSLTRAVIRFADRSEGSLLEGRFEIVSLTGTLSPEGDHLHVSVSDGEGRTLGGHLLDGSLVYTTAEIALGELSRLEFRRETDPRSGYKELVVAPRPEGPARH